MNILIDINHPAHVHMYHYFAKEMQRRGHEVLFVCRNKEFEVQLLTDFGFDFIILCRKRTSLIGKICVGVWSILRIWLIAVRFRIDVFVSHSSPAATYVSKFIGKPHITFDDTFNMKLLNLYASLTKVIFTSDYTNPLDGRDNMIHYPGYKGLLYLHPNWFTPQIAQVRHLLHLSDNEKFIIVRFVAWNATHDRGCCGITIQNKVKAITTFAQYGHVFISSEGALPPELETLVNTPNSNISRFDLAPEWMHHAEAAATLIYGESSTMVAEGAELGTPGVCVNSAGLLLNLKDIQDKYNLCYRLCESPEDQLKSIEIAQRILSGEDGVDYQAKRAQLLREKIDVTAFLIWFIENYPASKEQAKNANEEFWKQFK